jgi:hypothetical protein
MSPVRSRFHGAERDPETGGRLLMRETVEMGGLDDLPVHGRHPVEGKSDLPGLPGSFERLREDRHVGIGLQRDPTLMAPLPPVDVDGGTPGDGV